MKSPADLCGQALQAITQSQAPHVSRAVINNKDFSRIRDHLSEDYIEIHGNMREKVGFEEAKQRVLGMYNTFPDFHIRVDRQIARGGLGGDVLHDYGNAYRCLAQYEAYRQKAGIYPGSC